jgi:hypothetical protein
MDISYTTNPNEVNHVRTDYNAANIFLAFPTKQKLKTFVNGTESERTIAAGTLVGLTTADQTIAKPVESDASDGSEIGYGVVLYDIVIPAGAAEEVEGLVGWNGIIFADKVVLEKVGDTLDTNTTETGQSIRNTLLNSNSLLQIEDAAQDVSGVLNEQV